MFLVDLVIVLYMIDVLFQWVFDTLCDFVRFWNVGAWGFRDLFRGFAERVRGLTIVFFVVVNRLISLFVGDGCASQCYLCLFSRGISM